MNRNIRAASILIAVVLLVCSFSGCTAKTPDYSKYPASKMQSDDDWSTANGEAVVLENDYVRFEMDTETTHFTVTNLKTGKKYFSVPNEANTGFSEEIANRLNSEITVTYYEEQSNATYMNSDTNSVKFGNYKVNYSDDTVRVYYDLSLTDKVVFAPNVLDKDTFEITILEGAEDPNVARRLSRYYTLYDPKEKADDFDDKAELYPIVKTTPLYIINDSVSDVEKEEISDYMDEAGYTPAQYAEMLKELGIEDNNTVETVGFIVPVEYSITEDGFKATILADGVVEKSKNHKLQTITLLEYFASTEAGAEGQYIVPDGSGALIDMKTEGKSNFKQSFYGTDESIDQSEKAQITKNLTLPIFAVSQKDGGVLGIVESAAEVGQLNIGTTHNHSPQNHIYVDFTMRHMDATDVGELMQIPVYNLFSKHLVQVSPSIRYVLLEPGKSDYVSVAYYYREYLKKNNGIVDKKIKDAPVYLSYLCSIKKDATFIGVPYQKTIVLSTISEIRKSLEKLHEAGVGPLNVRLFGYTDKGLSHGVYNEFDIDKKVGTKEELKKLSDWLSEVGGKLYLDADFQFVYTDGRGDDFSPKDDSAHYLNRSIVRKGIYNIVTRDYENASLKRIFVSPTRYMNYSTDFIKSVDKDLGNISGLSYASAGAFLGGDYTSKKDLDRTMSLHLLKKALDKASKDKNLIFENGNAYVLPYADAILNVSSVSSRFDIEYRDVPLYQIVLHGMVPYTSTAQNLAVNPVQNYLRTIEYGGMLSYTLITGQNDLLVDTEYENELYSLSDDELLDTIISQYSQAKDYWKNVGSAEISENVEISTQVYKTTYKNGHGVFVNYSDKNVEVEGVTVPATSFVAF